MKKQANPKKSPPSKGPLESAEPASKPEALDSSEITLVLPNSLTSGFDPLPRDFAPTCPIPETHPSVPPPEYRQPDNAFEEDSTLAMPLKDLHQIKTADIPFALLPDGHSEPVKEAQETNIMSRSTPAKTPSTPKHAASKSRKLWLVAGIVGLLLVAGGATWFLWPSFQDETEDSLSEATQDSAPAAPEAVPPELRSYLAHANEGDAKAMHMIALMYWNGLNVRQDRVKGLDWYRKAAAAGDKAAQKELGIIGGK